MIAVMMMMYLLVKNVKSMPQIMQLTIVLSSTHGQRRIICRFSSAGDLEPGPERELPEVMRVLLDTTVGVGGDDHTLDSFIAINHLRHHQLIIIIDHHHQSSPSSSIITIIIVEWKSYEDVVALLTSSMPIVVADSFFHVLNSIYPVIL